MLPHQTNVNASERRRIMQYFEDFQRKAVVVVPCEKVYTTRLESQRTKEGKEEPDQTILDMKGESSIISK